MAFLSFIKDFLFIGFIIGVGIAAIYFLWVRPWILRMGTTCEEVTMPMAGDDFVLSPGTKYTQAITIHAPKELVWAYLVQIGYKRAGWYNWDFINRLASKEYFYENNRSADRIIPELQQLKAGDKIYLVPQIGMEVSEFKEKESLLLTGHENGKYLVTWSYLLKEIDRDTTRFYVRWNSDLGKGIVFTLVNTLITEPGGVGIQQSQMLKGIKKRAERDYIKLHASSLS